MGLTGRIFAFLSAPAAPKTAVCSSSAERWSTCRRRRRYGKRRLPMTSARGVSRRGSLRGI